MRRRGRRVRLPDPEAGQLPARAPISRCWDSRASGDVRLESAKVSPPGIDQVAVTNRDFMNEGPDQVGRSARLTPQKLPNHRLGYQFNKPKPLKSLARPTGLEPVFPP